MEMLFSIGDMAKLFHLSVSSLRHYETVGLLRPERIDPDTGYRYYSTRQFEVLNTIRYLRALDLPLKEIDDFLQNRDIDRMEEKLRQQKAAVMEKQQELQRIARKIDNRLQQLALAQTAVLDKIELVQAPACRMVWLEDSLKINKYVDMETPVGRLLRFDAEAVVFIGKVGVGISAEHLRQGSFSQYDGIFLVLDAEDRFQGETLLLPETTCVRVRFRGSHPQAPKQYEKLLAYLHENLLEVAGFSREITMVDEGLTSDTEKFLTEISIPVKRISE